MIRRSTESNRLNKLLHGNLSLTSSLSLNSSVLVSTSLRRLKLTQFFNSIQLFLLNKLIPTPKSSISRDYFLRFFLSANRFLVTNSARESSRVECDNLFMFRVYSPHNKLMFAGNCAIHHESQLTVQRILDFRSLDCRSRPSKCQFTPRPSHRLPGKFQGQLFLEHSLLVFGTLWRHKIELNALTPEGFKSTESSVFRI